MGIVTGGKRINCDFLVLPDKHLPNRVAHDDLQQVRVSGVKYKREGRITIGLAVFDTFADQ